MSTPVDFEIERIRAYVKKTGWSKLRVAREAGMADTVLRKFDDDDWNPTRETLQKLSAIIPATFRAGEEIDEDPPALKVSAA